MQPFPVGSSLRGGEPDFYVRHAEGRSFPTDGFMVWAVSQLLHRDSSYWTQPEIFLPNRWLVGPNITIYPIKGAWRPFEYGPRNCIGQELGVMEMKKSQQGGRGEGVSAFARWAKQWSSLQSKASDKHWVNIGKSHGRDSFAKIYTSPYHYAG